MVVGACEVRQEGFDPSDGQRGRVMGEGEGEGEGGGVEVGKKGRGSGGKRIGEVRGKGLGDELVSTTILKHLLHNGHVSSRISSLISHHVNCHVSDSAATSTGQMGNGRRNVRAAISLGKWLC